MVGGMKRQNISSGSPYEPVIGFSRAVRIGNTIAISGTAPIDPDGKTAGPGDVAAQTRRCCAVAAEVLAKAGGSLNDVIRTRMFLTRAEDWEAAGKAHGESFGAIRPASTMVIVKALLNAEWLIEMEFDAVVGDRA
jgi:enamine deaminase RidA (YjgF/YER057c/UK114 family)